MNRKMAKRNLWTLLLALLLGIQVCAAYAANIDPVKGEYVKGKYTNKAPVFTVSLPEEWVAAPPQKNEIYRIIGPHPWKVPVAAMEIADKPQNAPALDSEAAIKDYLNFLKKNEPQSANYKIEKKGVVTLKDGTKAMTLIIRWDWTPTVELISAVLEAYRGDKIIYLICSTVEAEGTSGDDMLNLLKTLEFK